MKPMEVDSKSAGLRPLQFLQKFSYSADLPSWNCLKWSQSNRLVGLNVCDRLLIFQLNINYAINESTINRKKWCEDNLKFSVVTIHPEHEFEFNVGRLENTQQSYRQGYIRPNPRMARSELIYFDFSPSSPFRSYSLIGAITADYVFQLYLQYNSQPWQCVCNLSQRLNSYYIENKWNNLEEEKISFTEHCQRLDSLSITCFCFDSQNSLPSDRPEYSLCTATKTGDIVFWNISLSNGEGEGSASKCEANIEKIVSSGFQEIVTLQIISDNWLLIEAECGKVVLFDLVGEDILCRSVRLWDEADNLPCYRFCFTHLQNGSTEIVFHKVQTVIRANVSKNFKLESVRKYPLEDNTELLAICNYGGKYCASQYNTSSLWLIDFSESNSSDKLLLQSQIKLNGYAFNQHSSVYDIAFSTNQTIVAFVGNINTFCSQSSVLKNVELIFCGKEDAEFACNFVQKSLIASSDISTNLTDCLYLIRYHHFHKTNFEASLEKLLQFTLDKFENLSSFMDDPCQEPSHLLRLLKTVRFIVRRFEELPLLSPETNFIDDSTLQRVQKLRIQLEKCIRRLTTEEVLASLLKGDMKDATASRLISIFTGEQMVSLYNISQQMPLNRVYKAVLDQVGKLVNSKAKTAFAGVRSSFGTDFNSDNARTSKCLLNLLNRCSLCERSPSKLTADMHCPHHEQMDVCANSLLITDPLQNDIELCVGCLESKLISPRIWPSQATAPFDYSYDRCLFCL